MPTCCANGSMAGWGSETSYQVPLSSRASVSAERPAHADDSARGLPACQRDSRMALAARACFPKELLLCVDLCPQLLPEAFRFLLPDLSPLSLNFPARRSRLLFRVRELALQVVNLRPPLPVLLSAQIRPFSALNLCFESGSLPLKPGPPPVHDENREDSDSTQDRDSHQHVLIDPSGTPVKDHLGSRNGKGDRPNCQ